MARVSRGVTSHARHNKVIKAAKGYYGRRKNTFKVAKQAVDKARHMPIVTDAFANASSAPCGFSVLMLLHASMV